MSETQSKHVVLDADLKAWYCPVCGLKRNMGNHSKCSKITQQKFKEERAKKLAIR